jgi:glycosyltransferase involved in cell wall biosynthesis
MIEQHTSTLDVVQWERGAFPHPLISTPPSSTCELCVVIPVRDEGDTLPATLTSLSSQADLDGQPLDPATYEIVILANNCQDNSAAIVHSFARRYPQISLHVVEVDLPPAEAHVGHARRLVMDEAYRRLTSLAKPRGIIATTDGDTRVSPVWIAATRAEIDRGAARVPSTRRGLPLASRRAGVPAGSGSP